MENILQDTTGSVSYLFIKLNHRLFAINGHHVIEVCEVPNMIKVPGSPQYLRGIVQYNNTYIPVIDLRAKLNMPKTDFTVNTSLLIYKEQIHHHECQFGLLADAIHEVKLLTGEEQLVEKEFLFEDNYFNKLNSKDGSNVLIINMEYLFTDQDLTFLLSAVSNVSI